MKPIDLPTSRLLDSPALAFDIDSITSVWTDLPLEHFRSKPAPVPTACGKRSRAVADVDGDADEANHMAKKRRLRLQFITSALSRPFAAPSTYINGRSAFTAARLAFQRRIGRSLLRRAAIENWMRLRRGLNLSVLYTVSDPRFAAAARLEALDGTVRLGADEHHDALIMCPTQARSPSPLGLSNYQALDLEENPFDEGSWSGADDEMDWDTAASSLAPP